MAATKSDRKIQDMGQTMYLFTFHMIKITQRMQFFLQKEARLQMCY